MKPYIIVNDIEYNIEIEVKERKTMAIIVSANGKVKISAPIHASSKQIFDFLLKKKKWIARKILILKENLERNQKISQNNTINELLYKGKYLPLTITIDPLIKHYKITLKNDTFEIYSPEETNIPIKELVEKYYRNLAKRETFIKVELFKKQIGVSYNRITIKSQKTRWGSCSSKGNLNFNWKIMMMPEGVFDYLIVHELCHLVHMNHSKDFWNLVIKHFPQAHQSRIWLKENEKYLFI